MSHPDGWSAGSRRAPARPAVSSAPRRGGAGRDRPTGGHGAYSDADTSAGWGRRAGSRRRGMSILRSGTSRLRAGCILAVRAGRGETDLVNRSHCFGEFPAFLPARRRSPSANHGASVTVTAGVQCCDYPSAACSRARLPKSRLDYRRPAGHPAPHCTTRCTVPVTRIDSLCPFETLSLDLKMPARRHRAPPSPPPRPSLRRRAAHLRVNDTCRCIDGLALGRTGPESIAIGGAGPPGPSGPVQLGPGRAGPSFPA